MAPSGIMQNSAITPISQGSGERGKRLRVSSFASSGCGASCSTILQQRTTISAAISVTITEWLRTPSFWIRNPPLDAPNRPPRLQKAWQDDMIARRICFSVATALAFIATSIAPINPPNSEMATAPVHTFPVRESSSSMGVSSTAANFETVLEPNRAIWLPAIGIMMIEPRPKARIINPSSFSLSPRREANSGIFGAHEPIMKPFIRKRSATPARSLVR
ncbi:hypothetical protein D3C73_511700 [compost metagenome]